MRSVFGSLSGGAAATGAESQASLGGVDGTGRRLAGGRGHGDRTLREAKLFFIQTSFLKLRESADGFVGMLGVRCCFPSAGSHSFSLAGATSELQ